jgi:hypothetical protein
LYVGIPGERYFYAVKSNTGSLQVRLITWTRPPALERAITITSEQPERLVESGPMYFLWKRHNWTGTWELFVPHWTVALALAPLPAWWLARCLRASREGLCLACGYDLRGTSASEGERCPKCGADCGGAEATAA